MGLILMTVAMLAFGWDLDAIGPYCEAVVGLCMVVLGALGIYRAVGPQQEASQPLATITTLPLSLNASLSCP